jgi:hypothetical protein
MTFLFWKSHRCQPEKIQFSGSSVRQQKIGRNSPSNNAIRGINGVTG